MAPLEALLSSDLLLPGVLAVIAAAAAFVLLYKVLPPPASPWAPTPRRKRRQLASGKNNGDGDDDDDDEATKTRLGIEREIDALLRERKAVPLNPVGASRTTTHAESKIMAEQLRTIAQKIEERELQLEEMRVAHVLTEFQDSHPAAMGDCPICFDPLGDFGRMTGLFCCGAKLCTGCHQKVTKSHGRKAKKQHGSCPLCRARLPRTLEEQFRTVKEHAENGRSWAQSGVGYHYEFGTGTSVDVKEAKRWYHRAAEQQNPDAMYHLGRLLYEKEQSYKQAREYLIAASDLGHTAPHGILGDMCRRALGVRKDMVEANRYFTLTVACNPESPDALLHLGATYSDGDGWFEKSSVRAKHYLERAAESKQKGGGACLLLGTLLVELGREQYNDGCVLGGHNSTPRALYYLRKAVAADDEAMSYAAAANAEELENQMQSFCHGCMKAAECCPRELKRCTKCRAVWYCTRGCQLKHWKDGHKADCIRSS